MTDIKPQAVFLVIDDDVTFASVLARSLTRQGYTAHVAHDADSALHAVQQQSPDYAVLDLKLADTTGLQLLPRLLAVQPALRVVVLTGYASVATVVDAIKAGAANYLCKPATTEEILLALQESSTQGETTITAQPLSIDRVEWEYIQRNLLANDGNVAATARALGMHRRTLQRKLQKRPSKGNN